jgi:hypothetical protein
MAKKEFPDKQAPKIQEKPAANEGGIGGLLGDFSSKLSGFSSKFFGIVKFILAIILLPLLYSAFVSFINEFGQINPGLQKVFYAGVASFLAIYLFVWEPAVIYNRGHKLMEASFGFFKPMVNVAPFLLPIYTLFIFIIYGILAYWVKGDGLLQYALFLIGFTIILHLVFASKTIRSKKGDFLKANYIFSSCFIFILNLSILALGLSFIFQDFSFVNFCNASFNTFQDILQAVFKQLFVF